MLVLRVEFLRGVFDGGDADGPDQPEWPPSWMRVFSGLVDRSNLESESSLLERLERLPRPEVRASVAALSRRGAYVPTNWSYTDQHTTTMLGRTNNERYWAHAVPSEPVVEYVWRDEDWSEADRDALAGLARRVPYVGRASSPAVVSVDVDPVESDRLRSLVPYEPVTADRFAFAARVRLPFPGSLDALRRAHDAKQAGGSGDPWQVGVWEEYGVLGEPREQPVEGPYQEMFVLSYDGSRLDGRNTTAVTRNLRKAVMARVGEPMAALHGHDESGTRRIAFVALVDVGHPNARGHVLGAAICTPALDEESVRKLARALPAGGESITVTAGRLGLLSFRRVTPSQAAREARGLRTGRWTAPSSTWTTALPLVADRFLKPGDSVSEAMERMVGYAGLPRLKQVVEWRRQPLVPGGLDLAPRDTLRRPDDRGIRPYFHVTFELQRPVRGPVIIGSMRHYGLGLCVPVEVAQ